MLYLFSKRETEQKKGRFMTTSINSVNAGSTAASESVVKKSSLSDSTKRELEALGITATDGMTESQARQKINDAKNDKGADTGAEQQNDKQNASETEILSDAKTLAAEVGVTVASDADISEILDDISNELEAMLEEAENNPGILSVISSYLSELTSLDDQYDSLQNFQTNMYSSMEMRATNNKLALGLN